MESVVTADVEFHEVLYRASRNERLADIVHNLREQTYRFRSFSMNQPGRLRKTWEEHRQLVEAIASHNATQARKVQEFTWNIPNKPYYKVWRNHRIH